MTPENIPFVAAVKFDDETRVIRHSIDDATPEEWDEASAAFRRVVVGPLAPPPAPAPTPLDTQVGGGHYKKLKIQPVEYCHANGIPFLEGNAIKYLTRWRDKGGIADLQKARHMIDMLIELESKKG